MEIPYIVIFLLLATLLTLFYLLILFYYWITKFNSYSDKSQTNGITSQSSKLKIILKIASVYIVLHKELLTIPSFVFIFDIFKCGDTSTTSSIDSYSHANIREVHKSTGLECWGPLYDVLLVFGLIHLLLLIIFEFLKIIYMNDSYPESQLPWTQFSFKPLIINSIINIGYSLWVVLDTNHIHKIYMDAIALVLCATGLVFRIVYPLHQSAIVKRVTIFLEIGRSWALVAVLLHSFFKVSSTPFCIILESLVCLFYIILFLRMIQIRQEYVFMSGIVGKISHDLLQVYLQQVIEYVSIDKKITQIRLHGFYQTHIQSCVDYECPCGGQFKNLTTNDDTETMSTKHNKQILTTQGSKFQNYINQNITKASDILLEQFRLRKSSFVNKNDKNSDYESHDHELDNQRQKLHKQINWYSIINYQLKKRLDKLKKLTIPLRFLIAIFYFSKMKNEFKALFELIQADNLLPKLNQKFVIYRLKMRIEKVIQQKHEKSTSLNRKINIMQLNQYEKNYSIFQDLILENTLYSIKFWSELLEKDLNAVKIHELGITITNIHKKINELTTQLTKIYPHQLIMLLTYSRYLNDVINNEYNASDYFQMAVNSRVNFRVNQKINEENEELLFGENAFCSVFVLKTEYKKLGIIEFCNKEVQQQFGYTPEQLIGSDINIIIPKIIANVHASLMMKFFDKAESSVLNKVRELFAKDKDGYLVPIYLFSKVLPSLTDGLKLIGVIKRIQHLTFQPEVPQELQKLQQEYIICDSENNILNFTQGLTIDFGLFPKMFQSTNGNSLFDQQISLDCLSSEFSDKRQDLIHYGSHITINTNIFFQKVDREVLTNEEFNYFVHKLGSVQVFCQMAEFNFSQLAEIKIYRIILLEKMHTETKIEDEEVANQEQNDQNLFDSAYQIQGGSQSSSRSSSILSLDRQLKDFKKQLTDNSEPKQVSLIRRIIKFLLLFNILIQSLMFFYHLQDQQNCSTIIYETLDLFSFTSKFIQVQLNIRSILNLANNIETDSDKLFTDLPYQNRVDYLNKQAFSQIEDIRQYLLEKKVKDDDAKIMVREINGKGSLYNYKLQTKQVLDQYITKAIDLINRNTSVLKTSVVHQIFDKNFTNITYNDSTVATSAFYVIDQGYKIIIEQLEQKVLEEINVLSKFESEIVQNIRWLDLISVLFIILAKILLIIVIQFIENNKVSVLSLYSEIKVIHVKKSLKKSTLFYKHLLNIQDQYKDNFDSSNNNTTSLAPSEGYDFREQWRGFYRRIQFYKRDKQYYQIEKLRNLLIKQSQIDNGVYKLHDNSDSTEQNKQQLLSQSSYNQESHKIINLASDFSLNRIDQENAYGTPLFVKEKNFESRNQHKSDKADSELSLQNQNQRHIRRNLYQSSQTSYNQMLMNSHGLMGSKRKRKQQEIEQSEEASSNAELEEIKENENDNVFVQSKRRKRKDGIQEEEKEIPQSDERIGKNEHFAKIKKKNWKQVIIIVIITLVILGFFAFSYFYQVKVNQDVESTAIHMKLGYFRQSKINLLYGYFRERLILNENQYIHKENKLLKDFYSNEEDIKTYTKYHPQFSDFLYSFLAEVDSKLFCIQQTDDFIEQNCSNFENGILEQGYQQALFSYVQFYTQTNLTLNTNQNLTYSQRLKLLNTDDVQSFFIAAETYFTLYEQLLSKKWKEETAKYFQKVSDAWKAVFVIFLLVFFFAEAVIIPIIIKQLNETTWRSRGILNLVPNEMIKEMKQNSKILQLFKH